MRRRFINKVNTAFDNYMFVESLYNETHISINNCSPTLMYKVDDTNWEIVGDNSFNYTLQHIGEKIFFKDVRYVTPSGVGRFTANIGFKVGGDFRSLFLGDNVKENSPLLDFCFNQMFMDSNLECFDEDILYYPILAINCYHRMFERCHKITNAPKLPATTLSDHCYSYMFHDCSNLKIAYELPATTLTDSCYSSMFSGCTSLTTAPELPATTLADSCYVDMFYGCSKLNYIKMLATNISANSCLYNWVNGVASTGTFVKSAAMRSLPTGVSGIPSGWTVVNDGEDSGEEKLITFYIKSANPEQPLLERKATSGMTWGEWVLSDFNLMYENIEDNGFSFQYFEDIGGDISHYNEGWVVSYVEMDSSQYVKSNDIIEDNFIYKYCY